MISFSIYLLQLMTNNDSLIYQKLPILKFYHKYQEPSSGIYFFKANNGTPVQFAEYMQI